MRHRRKRPKKRGYVRPSRAEPKAGWSRAQLAQLSGVSARAIRDYLERGLLPRPRFKGPATRYGRTQLVWLLALRRVRTSEGLPLATISTRLRALSAADLEAVAMAGLAAGSASNATAAALGVASTGAPSSASAPATATSVAAAASGTNATHWPRWARVELALGLELHVSEDASPRVQELARRVRELSRLNVSNRSAL